jgi:acyl-CoA synthetase (AMP-forming)/AMP-acid ligase II
MANDENSLTTKLTLSYVHNASSRPFQYRTVAQTFNELATRHPDYECYVFKGILSNYLKISYFELILYLEEDKRYTYATFKHEVDCMALALLELGFEKNDRLLVALPNCSQNAVLIYVAAKLGLVKVHLYRSLAVKLGDVTYERTSHISQFIKPASRSSY